MRKKSFKSLTTSTTRWLSKFSTGFCRVGKMLKIYKYQTHSNCPRCNQPKESTAHILQCKEALACELWDKSIDKLYDWALKQDLSPDLAHHMKTSLHSWKYSQPITCTSSQPVICMAIQGQQ